MTVIAGLVDNGTVYMAGDSSGISGYQVTVRRDEKVFRNGPYVIGFTTSFRMGQLLRYALDPPMPPEGRNLHEFMCIDFVNALRECLKVGGWAMKDKEQEEGGKFLVGIHGRLFCIESDYQVGETLTGYMAVGCGDETALGALYASGCVGMDPESRLFTAMDAAAAHNIGVCAPFGIVDTKDWADA